ncbi:MAG: FecR family protein [Kiloniellaceae bacterium]
MTAEENNDIAERARAWVVRLASGEMTDSELADFKAWLGAAPAHHAAFVDARALWQRLAPLQTAFERLERAETARPAEMTLPVARRSRHRAVAAAALALAACALLAVFAPQIATRLEADYASGNAVRVVALADGSRVTLDRHSAIAVDFAAERRRVELLAGEAFFEVKPDPRRPFAVAAAGGISEAVGTAYAVRLTAGGARVAVTEGRVAVSWAGTPVGSATRLPLAAGEGLRYGANGRADAKFALDGRRALAWRDGKVIFANRPLSEALAELERYHPGRIVLWGDGRRLQPVSGVIDLDRLEEGLAALAATHGLRAVQVTPYLTVLR